MTHIKTHIQIANQAAKKKFEEEERKKLALNNRRFRSSSPVSYSSSLRSMSPLVPLSTSRPLTQLPLGYKPIIKAKEVNKGPVPAKMRLLDPTRPLLPTFGSTKGVRGPVPANRAVLADNGAAVPANRADVPENGTAVPNNGAGAP